MPITVLSAVQQVLTARPVRDRVVLVTGATSGVGRATALRLARDGAKVVAVARDLEALDRLRAEQPGITPLAADLADATERAAVVDAVLAERGRIDVLVHCVGVGWSGAFEDMTAEQVRVVVDTDVTAAIDLTRLVVRHQLARDAGGDVVLVGSAASWFASPSLTVYSATKSALHGFAQGARRELLTRGVRVHEVHPGLVSTQFAARSAGGVPGDLPDGAADDGPLAPLDGPGMDPDRVAAAIERVLTRPGLHDHAVPRVLGLTRLLDLPPFSQVSDVLVGLAGAPVARLGRAVADLTAGRRG